jgi:hypothetical protein
MICNITMNHCSCDVDALTVLGASATFETLQDQELTFDVKTTSVFRNVLVIDIYVQVLSEIIILNDTIVKKGQNQSLRVEHNTLM